MLVRPLLLLLQEEAHSSSTEQQQQSKEGVCFFCLERYKWGMGSCVSSKGTQPTIGAAVRGEALCRPKKWGGL